MKVFRRLCVYLVTVTLILMTMHGWIDEVYQRDYWVFMLCVVGLFFVADTTYIVAETDLPTMITVPVFGLTLLLFYLISWHIKSVDLGFFSWLAMTVITHILFLFAKFYGDRLYRALKG